MNILNVPSDAWKLDETEVHIWFVQLNVNPTTLQDSQLILSFDEQQRAARFHHLTDKHRYVVARAVLRSLLSAYLSIEPNHLEFVYSPFGKPELAAPFSSAGISFNLSHSGHLGLYGIIRSRKIGVDLERLRPEAVTEEMARVIFSHEEFHAFFSLPRQQQIEAFFNCWTRKEAYLKARGEGLSYPLNQVQVTFAPGILPHIVRVANDTDTSADWTLFHLDPSPGYVAAVAVEGRNLKPKIIQWLT